MEPTANVTAPQKKPADWWSLRKLEGTRELVTAAIAAAPDVPDRWKNVLQAEIAEMPPEFNFVRLDAHSHDANGTENVHITFVKSKKLV